ncbi:MAG TPA: S41 family peptidase [Pyrinomonadaceae bacterium]|nr:S41 family peptidase [Pyrinomonadaceae bacterium]
MKKTITLFAAALLLVTAFSAFGREARLVRYPHYHNGRVVFTYLGDIWTADENGQNVQRLTVNRARDVYGRFSPDGKWIAFSSDRNGNLDVFLIPAGGGQAKQLTNHSADDTVLGWSADSRAVLFSSNRGEDFMPQLYLVSVDGGMPWKAGTDMGVQASYSPDGQRLAYNQKGQVYWRKYYRGAYQTDIMVMDVAAKKFTQLTDFDGLDSWPMWGRDGYIYFVSDRDGGGLTNIWRISENGGKADRFTTFKTGDVRWPAISSDGKVIVFEHDFGIWKLDVNSKRATPINLNIDAETQDNLTDLESFNSQADDYDLAPNSRHVAFSIHGEIFTAPVEEGDLKQLTDGPARDRAVDYSPDGKWLAYISDQSGREELYVVPVDASAPAQKLTDIDALKFGFNWSPDSKEIAFAASDDKLRKLTVATKQVIELDSSRYGGFGGPVWSPDGKWIAYSKQDATRTSDIYMIASSGAEKEPHRVTFDSNNDANPDFAPDGRKLYFQRVEATAGGNTPTPNSVQIYSVWLEHLDKDPDDAEERAEAEPPARPAPAEGSEGADAPPVRPRPQPNRPPREIKVDWDGLKRRTRQITRMPFPIFNYTISPDSRTIVFTTSEPAGPANIPVVYSVQEDGRRLTRVTAGLPPQDAEGGGPGGGGGFGGGISDLNVSRDGRTLFFRERDSIYSVPLSAGAGQGAGAATAAAGGGPGGAGGRRRINFNVRVRVDHQAEWAEMFDDGWRTMKYRFYDPKMHGMDWDAARAKYRPLVDYVGDRQELLNIINEMIGELNASHTGAAPPPGGRREGVSTGHLGVELEPDQAAGRYRVAYIYEDGPADKDWVKVKVGDYLLAIDGKQVKAGDEYWQLLNNRLNRKVTVTFNSKPSDEGAWNTRIETINTGAYSQLRYDRWVKDNRKKVDQLSGGRIGYLHIQAMNPPSLRKFEKEIREFRNKEALIIDQRWNGGGNIEQELLAILVQRQYQVWQPRGTEATGRPFAGFFGPKVVLQNWRSASNAEMFPAGFRALGLGKVIGTPTMGAVIGTGSYSLIDGSTVRTPGVGVFLADAKHTNMENYGVQPDIMVENKPEDALAGRDRQLEAAVEELMKQLNGSKRSVTTEGQQNQK